MITYLKGDATEPQGEGLKIIAHCCNDISGGVWGAGFTSALDRKWSHIREQYVKWSKNEDWFKGGMIQIVPAEKNIYICNMIGQHGIVGPKNPKPVNYEWLFEGMNQLNNWITNYRALKFHMGPDFLAPKISIHCPRFGAGLAKGDWNTIELLIKVSWSLQYVYIYDLE